MINFFFNIYAKIALGCAFKIHPYSSMIDVVFNEFLKSENIKQTYEHHHVTWECEYGTLKFWNSNKYYAWLSRGHVISPSGNITFAWNDECPSYGIMYRVRNKIRNIMMESFLNEK